MVQNVQTTQMSAPGYAGESEEAWIGAICALVDQTLMPRKLRIEFGSEKVFVECEVREQRLTSIVDVRGVRAPSHLRGEVLPLISREASSAVARLFMECVSFGGEPKLTNVSPPSQEGALVLAGLGTLQLRDAMNVA